MARVPCVEVGCNEPVRARKMCQRHYNAWNYARKWKPSVRVRECLGCATAIATPDRRIYCSAECKRVTLLAAARAKSAARRAATAKTCPQCASEFTPAKSLARLYCSDRCARKATRDALSRFCNAPECDRPHRAKGLCNMHYKAALRAEGRIKSAWDDRRRANYQKRRALKKGASAERIVPAEVFERDGWVCGICKADVDRDLAYPDPLSPSLDHVVPLSRGGAHSLSNVQLAHLGCNVEKGARIPA